MLKVSKNNLPHDFFDDAEELFQPLEAPLHYTPHATHLADAVGILRPDKCIDCKMLVAPNYRQTWRAVDPASCLVVRLFGESNADALLFKLAHPEIKIETHWETDWETAG